MASHKKIGLLSASAIATATLTSGGAMAAGNGELTVDPFGRVAIDQNDIFAILDANEIEVAELYAGNNCQCTNDGCDIRDVSF